MMRRCGDISAIPQEIATHSQWNNCVYTGVYTIGPRVKMDQAIPMFGKDAAKLHKHRECISMEQKCSVIRNIISRCLTLPQI